MFFQLLFIHLFRPFLKYTQATSPLPATVSPRKLCTQAAAMISKLLRLYKRSHGLRQICNIAVYIAHSACTIHLLNLPEKNARRDIIHGVKHLEEIAEGWLCARRTLGILSVLARKWNVELPEEAATVLARTDAKFGTFQGDVQSPNAQQRRPSQQLMNPAQLAQQQAWQNPATIPTATGYFNNAPMPSTNAGAALRANSGVFSMPPSDANGLQARPYPSSTTTPASAPGHRSSNSRNTSNSGASPSDMFGGVEQLIRDSQDWVYRDQAQLATGFENWNMIDGEPSTWPNGIVGNGAVVNGGLHAPMNSNMPVNGASGFAMDSVNVNGYGLNGMNGMNGYGGGMTAYNEDEWYQ